MARYDTEHKGATRQRILDTASRRFKKSGIDGSGIAGLMTDAGLTNGAFYAHFGSKDDLVANVVTEQLRAQHGVLAALPSGRKALEEFIGDYLAPHHRDHPETGCPSAALLDEIGRCDAPVRDSYSAGIQPIVDTIAAHLRPTDPPAAQTTALGLLTLLIATIQLARAVPDRKLSDDILEAGIRNARTLLDAAVQPGITSGE